MELEECIADVSKVARRAPKCSQLQLLSLISRNICKPFARESIKVMLKNLRNPEQLYLSHFRNSYLRTVHSFLGSMDLRSVIEYIRFERLTDADESMIADMADQMSENKWCSVLSSCDDVELFIRLLEVRTVYRVDLLHGLFADIAQSNLRHRENEARFALREFPTVIIDMIIKIGLYS